MQTQNVTVTKQLKTNHRPTYACTSLAHTPRKILQQTATKAIHCQRGTEQQIINI